MKGKRQVLVMITPLSRSRIDGILGFAERHDWSITFHDRLGGLPPSFDYDGILATLRADEQTLDYVREARRRGIPAVDLTIQHPKISLPRVISDHEEIGRLAGRHFQERGIGHTAWFSSGWSHVHQLRIDGFSSSLRNPPDQWIATEPSRICSLLRHAHRPTGVLAYDETDAVRLLNLCSACGLSVPDDIAILSIGDDPLITDHQAVPISCIRQNFATGGYAAAELLNGLMNGKKPPEKPILIKPDGILVRRSTDTFADSNPVIAQALLYIRDNLARSFGAAQIADALGISRSRLDKTFVARFGHSVGEEILNRRLTKARKLLSERQLNVNEIARVCGFCSTSYFIRKFYERHGDTPYRWRKHHAVASSGGRQPLE